LVLLHVLFLYWWRVVSKGGWFVANDPFFFSPSFLSLTPENKFLSLLLLVFQIQSF